MIGVRASSVRHRGCALTGRVITPLCLIVLLGCAGIPDSGPVTEAGADRGTYESTVRYSPTGPSPDASPREIIRGYLDAMLAYPVSTGTATSFLTPSAAKTWKSSAGVRVYADPQVSTPVAPDNAGGEDKPMMDVDLDVVQDASLDAQGRFDRVNSREKFTFRLTQTQGQWRITNPQSGLLVNRKFFGDYYRPFSDYFFDSSGKRLVADPIYLPVGDQLSTALVSSLMRGPNGLLGKTGRTYVPAGARLRTSVPLRDDGLAEVQLTGDLTALSSGAQERLSAQIIWTLRQVDQITGVRITGGDNVLYPGNRGIQSIDSWDSFGPRLGSSGFYGAQKGKIVELSGRDVTAVDGLWGKGAREAVDLAVDSDQLAVLNGARSMLTIGTFDKVELSTYSGRRFLRPLWDDVGMVWALDRPGTTTRLRIFDEKRFRQIPIGILAKFRVESFALSPDGARYAFIARVGGASQVYVGSVLRDAKDVVVSLGEPRLLRPNGADFTGPRSISWATSVSVTFLADDAVAGRQIFLSRVDGSISSGGTASDSALLPHVEAIKLVTTGGTDPVRYVTDATGRIWLLKTGEPWERLGAIGVGALTVASASSTG